MTQLHQRDPEKQTTEPILGTALLEKKSKTVTTGWMGKYGKPVRNDNCFLLIVFFFG